MVLSFQTECPGKQCRTRSDCSKRSSLIRVYTVCHSVCFVSTHYSMVEPHTSNFRVITTNFLGVRIFRKFTVIRIISECWCLDAVPLSCHGGDFVLHVDKSAKVTKELIEKSRECHNHKPQPTLNTKRKRKMTNLTHTKQTNAREAHRPALSSSSEVITMLKRMKQEDKEHGKTWKHEAPVV